ncbi:aminotransferase class I/II-fold pyridoxal phosphate-dependent enzyme [Streptomyces sp. HNM0574]|uniref:aminotransferase class I/II-fold pyridoxal phosphate-dependent enzyme n=1 Tax=Streptomyces sp. HNM0574 TaxID=2714954 RepID=UPI00146CF2CE|nr:aminotransferase class I/II-fold pyridoxal phosphate-dependent enzyme [Streptomyces sp. HNM0574]NLU66144.1 aminotransferase class I/II-fold pyridoxal phosphate-dependent enzyme [Streptomyces sp. HNM0574]
MAAYLALSAAVTCLYMTLPALRAPLWALLGLGGAAAVVTGVRLHRPAHRWPWWALAGGLLTFAAGDTYYNVLETYFAASNPFPSLSDALYLSTYLLFAAGLFGLSRYRWVGRDLPGLLDALIFTGALALPVWVLLVQPLTQVAGLSWEQRAVSIAYPLGDVLVLALLVRLVTPGTAATGRIPAVRLLAVGTLTLLGFDIAYGMLQLTGDWQAGTLLDSGWVVFYVAWGLAALHPSMTRLTARAPRQAPLLAPARRLPLLALATLIAPGILLVEAARGSPRDAAVIAVFSGALFLLVILRLTGMVMAHRQAVARELALRTAATSLVAAARPEQITRCCETAVDTLFGRRVPHRTVLVPAERAEALHTATAPPDEPPSSPGASETGASETAAHGTAPPPRTRLLPRTALDPELTGPLDGLPTVLVCPMVRPDRPDRPAGLLLVAGPERHLAETRHSLEILASHAGLAAERIALRQEIIRQESEAYFRTLVRNASDVILIVDDDDTVRYVTPSARAVFGEAAVAGEPLPGLVDARDRERVGQTLASMRGGERPDAQDHWWVPREGGAIEVAVRCSDLRHDPTVRGVVVTLRDVTEQRRLEQELTQRAFHDPLTGLPNRTLLMERIERALLRGRREGTTACVLFLDLDDFKLVNDTMGHWVGDQLLTAVGERLSGALRATDTAARLGGDEFAVLMEGAREPADAELLAAELVHALGRPFRLPGGSVDVSASVGVATVRDSTGVEELLSHADLALYAAKSAGKRQWCRFRPRLRVRMLERHDLQAGLSRALTEDELTLRYQPVVDMADGDEVVGFEALARWRHPRRGLVPPQQFIGLAEETGQITPLGIWVLRHAAADGAELQRSGPAGPDGGPSPPRVPYVSVNVSAPQFRDAGFLDEVRGVLAHAGLAPGSLQLELTESVLMRSDTDLLTVMRELKSLGVRIAVDDFGTGFSSLRYLRELPVDVVKIDKGFIDDVHSGDHQAALVEGIVNLADRLGLQVIAEGVESVEQRDLLRDMGCRFGQGYLFARPMTADQGTRLLRGADGHHPTRARPAPAPRAAPPPGHPAPSPQAPPVTPPAGPSWAGARAADLERLRRTSPMTDAVLDEVDGRHIRSGDHWLVDFASCNYLGFDHDPEIMDAIPPAVRRWGTHPSWSRLLGSPRLYPDIEERLAALLRAPDTLLLPTATLIHTSVIPVLAGAGDVFVEATAHRTVYDGCVVARGRGATLHRFHAEAPGDLGAMLAELPPGAPRLVCVDGVNSMSGNVTDLPALARVCRAAGATLYVDDTHGFGVIGERGPDEPCPYGSYGNGIVRHTGESYDQIVLVGGFSKAYSSLLAFLALPTGLKNRLKTAAAPYLYSGPSPTASLATALAGLEVNERRGDAVRAELHRKTARVLDHTRQLGLRTLNRDGLPIVEIPLGRAEDLDAVAAFLWDRGIYVTLAAYPLVPRDRVGFRVQLTALNTDADIDRLNTAVTALCDRFPMPRGSRGA